MDSKQKNIWIGIVVIALIAGAYYFGTASKNSTESTGNIQDTKIPAIVQEQGPGKQTAPQTTNTEKPKPTQINTQVSIITNSQSCLTIANQAVQNEEAGGIMHNIKVLQAHFKQATNNCYYELQYLISGEIMTSIHYAPNDETIVTCANTSGICYQSGVGNINESLFHLIEAQYLEN